MTSADTTPTGVTGETVHVDLGTRAYDVLVGPDLVTRAGELLVARLGKARAAIVTDENVARHHLPALEASLAAVGRHAGTIVMPPGEATKSFAELGRLSEALLGLKLERVARFLESGFGFETLSLAVTVAERMLPQQSALATTSEETERAQRCTALLDALRQRLGPERVRHLEPVASHWPDRSEKQTGTRSEISNPETAWPTSATRPLRPSLLLPRAEPADVIALLPDGPPQRLRWRGKVHTIAYAQGPERIAAEWWRSKTPEPTRDYYIVENGDGQRLWMYREGIPGREAAAPRWFVHGLFP